MNRRRRNLISEGCVGFHRRFRRPSDGRWFLRHIRTAIEDQSGGGVVWGYLGGGRERYANTWRERRTPDSDVPPSLGFVNCPTDSGGGVVLLLIRWLDWGMARRIVGHSRLHGRRSHRRIETVPGGRVGLIRDCATLNPYLIPHNLVITLLPDVDTHI